MVDSLKSESSTKKEPRHKTKIIWVDTRQLFSRNKKNYLKNDFEIIDLNSTEEIINQIQNENIAIAVVVDYEVHPWYAVFELIKEINPSISSVMIAEIWNNQQIKESINRAKINKLFSTTVNEQELKIIFDSLIIDYEIANAENRLLKEVKSQNVELEILNSNLEKTVEERTQHIEKVNEELHDRQTTSRYLIRMIKDMTSNLTLEEILDIIRKEFKKYQKVREPILFLKTEDNYFELYYFQTSQFVKVKSKLHEGYEKIINSNEAATHLAKIFGRPFFNILKIPLSIRLTKEFLSPSAVAVLLLENHFIENELDIFLKNTEYFIKPFSIAVDRILIEKKFYYQSMLWENTFDGIQDPIAIIDSDFQVIRSNKKFANEIYSKSCFQRFAKSNSVCENCILSVVVDSKSSQSSQVKINGCLYEVNSHPILDNHAQQVRTVVNQYQDISHDRDLYMRLVQNEKMSAIGLLAGNIAHELNNPLTGIRSLTQLLIQENPHRPAIQQDLLEIEKAAQRSQIIIKNLQDFSKNEKQQSEITSWELLIDKTMPILKSVIRSHRVKIDLSKGKSTFMAEPYLLQQVIFNLISNACQAMVDRGDLEIFSEENAEAHKTFLHIKDSGPGIKKDIINKIFEPFFTTKPAGQGTGLGLSLSKSIIESLGGKLSLQSTEGVGSIFTIELPLEVTDIT